MTDAARQRPTALRYPARCATCALPVDVPMCRCPWCTVDFDGEAHAPTLPPPPESRPRASTTAACGACGHHVRPDWSACPWCASTFAWSLRSATEAVKRILEEAGARKLARRLRVRYSRQRWSFVMDGDDRNVSLVAARLRSDARARRWWDRGRRFPGEHRFFALEHPLHIALHEVGHVFEHFLVRRRLLDRDAAARMIGDLTEGYPSRGEMRRRVAAAQLRGRDRRFVSAYATIHAAEDFAETFAVVAFLRADDEALRLFARYRDHGPPVLRALRWMATLIRRHAT
jgi:hypothetical protein